MNPGQIGPVERLVFQEEFRIAEEWQQEKKE
jgi:hypothetical protein